jgi:hypothetical protein
VEAGLAADGSPDDRMVVGDSTVPSADAHSDSAVTDSTDSGEGSPDSQDVAADSQDVSSDSPAVSEAQSDAPAYANDPCVPNLLLDCDPTCCSADPQCTDPMSGHQPCNLALCETGPVTLSLGFNPVRARTPDKPGVDPQCASRCPSEGYVYGIGFKITDLPQASTNVVISVGPPWQIVLSNIPYCPNGLYPPQKNCVETYVEEGQPVYIVTTDPEAPARNVYFNYFSSSTACPADGGV